MVPSFEDLRAAKEALRARVAAGVAESTSPHRIGIGRRRSAGVLTEELALRLYISRKLPRSQLSRARLAPADIDGVPVDLIEAGPGRPQAQNTSWVRPLEMGHSVGHRSVQAGTMGAIVERTDEPDVSYLLSCSHVLAPPGAQVNDRIRQPAQLDDSGLPEWIAELSEWTGVDPSGPNEVDAAIARLLPGVEGDNAIDGVGPIPRDVLAEGAGVGRPLRVTKAGRTTGRTEGFVEDWDWEGIIDVWTEHGWQDAWYSGQLLVSPEGGLNFSEAGDSGAVAVELGSPSARTIGMVIAGQTSESILTPMHRILDLEGRWEISIA